MPAAPPTRSSSSLVVGWGMITVPCSVYASVESSGIRRKEFTADGHPVGRKMYDKVTEEDVAQADVVKMLDTPEGTVAISDDEIESVVSPIKGQADVQMFLPLSLLTSHSYVTDGMYQLRPQKDSKTKKVAPRVEQAFALLLASMAAEQVFGLVTVTLFGKPRYAALTPEGRLFTLHHDEAIRADLPMPAPTFSEAELAMGQKLVRQITQTEGPVLTDEATAKVMEYASTKAKTGQAPVVDAPVTAPVDTGDLLSLLEASIERVAS